MSSSATSEAGEPGYISVMEIEEAEALSEHGEKPAIVVMREEGAERWSYTDLETTCDGWRAA